MQIDEMSDLRVTKLSGWRHLILNRPQLRNALNTALLSDLAEQLNLAAEDPLCRAVLISGAEGNFAAGADISELESKTKADAAVDARKAYWAEIRAFPKPLVAAVDGYCLGGGLELALLADFMVLGKSAQLGMPETNLGLIPGAGGAQRLTALIGRARAMRLILMGEIIPATLAFEWGLGAWLADGSAMQTGMELCDKLTRRAPLALVQAKRAVVNAAEGGLYFGDERARFEALFDTVDKAEGIAAFKEKRKPEFKGQ